MQYRIFHNVDNYKSNEYFFVKLISYHPAFNVSSDKLLIFQDRYNNGLICNNTVPMQRMMYYNVFKHMIDHCFVINFKSFSDTDIHEMSITCNNITTSLWATIDIEKPLYNINQRKILWFQ